jgi:hypothetical protein
VWLPYGDLGYVARFNFIISHVKPRSPAAQAGLQIGDRIDLAATSPAYRRAAFWAATSMPGQQVTFTVARGPQERMVTLVSVPEQMDAATKALILGRELALFLFIGIGAALVLLRPSGATWGFYLYCLGLNGSPGFLAPFLFGVPWDRIVGLSQFCMILAGYVGVAVFGALFLHEPPSGWRALINRVSPIALLIFWGLAIYGNVAMYAFGRSQLAEQRLFLLFMAVATLIAMYGLVETYLTARGSAGRRIRWVVAGFGVALGATIIDTVLTAEGNPPYWLHGSLELSNVVVPLTVGYAVIKHRVIDVSFVVSRALVYTVLTTLLVGIFSLIDWFFADYLRLARLGTVAEVGAVIAFGFWFNGLHRRVDAIIDATFFRQRHRAEVQLARDAAALPMAESLGTVSHFLIDEPVRALSLASAALFRRRRDDVYIREASEAWTADSLSQLDRSDEPLLLLAKAENGPLSLYDHPWRTAGVPDGPARPILALPIVVRRELAAIVFYGSHLHGEVLDPDEIKAIAGLAPGAGAAYDHLEAEAMRQQVALLQKTVEIQQALLAEAQIQPT